LGFRLALILNQLRGGGLVTKKKYCAKHILLCCTLVPMVSKKWTLFSVKKLARHGGGLEKCVYLHQEVAGAVRRCSFKPVGS
jgi:phosphoribulokinase